MRRLTILLLSVLAPIVSSAGPAGQGRQATGVMLFEGARLITSNGPSIENSAFLVEDGRFAAVGRKGEVRLPAGAVRVDVTGKTIMPALIELHAHLGYWKGLTNLVENHTRDNMIDHLERFAYHGVAAVNSMGTDRRELAYRLRDELRRSPPPDTALYFTAGPGISVPDAGPGFPMRPAVYEVTTEAEARKAVQELAANKVDRFVKIWHDSTRKRLPPPIYRAIIDEAHKHHLKVVAHVQDLADVKDLLRAGLDGSAHSIWRGGVDDELIALLKARPEVFTLTTFWGGRNQLWGPKPIWMNAPMLRDTFTPEEILRLENPRTPADAEQKWAASDVPADIMRLKKMGLRFGIGGDVGGISGREYFGWSTHMELEGLVKAGLSPADAIAVGTRGSAEILGLDQLGAIAKGKSADFIVLDANPLDDIANTRRIARVYLRGHEVDRARLRAKWTGSRAN